MSGTSGSGRGEYDFGMEEGAGDAGSDGDEVALALEDFDLGRARVVGEIDGASATDAGGGEVVGGDRGEVGKELARVEKEGFDSWRESGFW